MIDNTDISKNNSDQSNKKEGRRLGRGLGSLLGGGSAENLTSPAPKPAESPAVSQTTTPPEARVWQIAIEKLVPSVYQPRTHFDKEALAELAQSIRENGILQPIVARRQGSGALEIIAGERRWRAAQLAGLHEVPVLVRTISNREALELAIIENIQREDLGAIEEAESYQRLIQEFGLTQQQVSEKVGKERATVANALRLLALPLAVRAMVEKKEISSGHAKVLLSLSTAEQMLKLANRILQKQLSVRALEKEVQQIKSEASSMSSQQLPNANLAAETAAEALAQDLQKTLGTKVQIDYRGGKGRILISFYSNDELSEIAEKVKAGCQI